MIQVTLTGQLALLMLIESLCEIVGVEVVSANTDGVTIRCRRDTEADAVAAAKTWEKTTGFELERADYDGLYSRDVNGYIAIKTNGEVKTKGPYGRGLPLHGNPHGHICSTAVIDYLQLGASIEGTIRACRDVREFLFVRKVAGGALWRGQSVGRIVRWYYANGSNDAIYYKESGYLVPGTEGGAIPVVQMPEHFPDNMNYDWYIEHAQSMLEDLGGIV